MGLSDEFKSLLRRCLAEFIGTFFLVLAVGLSSGAGVLGPFVPGLTLMVMVFNFGHVSLGVFNPAISLALTLRPFLLSWKAMAFYLMAQFMAGLLAAVLAWGFGGQVIPASGASVNLAVAFFAEFFGTFALATSVLNAGTSADYEGNSFFGLTIGGTLLAMVPVLGPLSGAVFNPAVAMLSLLAPLHNNTPVPTMAWIYFTAPFLAAALASLAFRFVSPRDHAPMEHLMRGPVDHPEDHVALPKSGTLPKSGNVKYETLN